MAWIVEIAFFSIVGHLIDGWRGVEFGLAIWLGLTIVYLSFKSDR